MHTQNEVAAAKYPMSMRLLHWFRAVLILGLIWSGWYMTGLPETTPMETFDLFYPNHKQFGLVVWLLALTHLVIRWNNRRILPQTPQSLKPWEKTLSHVVHRSIMALTILTPMFGYAMSSSFTQSDGVPFFGLEVPELLPKNDDAFAVYHDLHEYSAYVLLALVVLHVAGAMKHRFHDKGGETDVLPRML